MSVLLIIIKKMKKLIFVFALVLVFGGFTNSASAACDIVTPCGNGPIVAQQPGGRFLRPGQEDCPAWFFFAGCYTMRPVGSYFIPLN